MAVLTPGNARPILRARNLWKSFGHIVALRGVNLDVFEGEVLALMGDNGAGKSTLIKILSGVYKPDKGEIYIAGRLFKQLTPAQALKNGITTVYQDLALVDCRDICSNVFLGREPTRAGFLIDKKKMEIETASLLKRLKVNIPVINVLAGSLSGGQRQALAIARAIHKGGRVMILDEPTAAMGLQETKQVLALINTLREQGYAVILISHNLQQVFSIADRICVLRHGESVGHFIVRDTSPDEIVKLITGT
ncbi:Fructose import ATP-binding protein FrcA [Neomoorella glycerini]|uniref:Fructose import ATP-binding protein FrcA n=1 Tax=Neomoorella glycerini TaxID=55779 RepID=A0A6I5ZV62_9FIRM|nr:ATP-binding cassette domain-containing protein [Moorella glycerini]QGP93539.1 Fructose import ATP-binding protein FrcA [Moorella glycerini]